MRQLELFESGSPMPTERGAVRIDRGEINTGEVPHDEPRRDAPGGTPPLILPPTARTAAHPQNDKSPAPAGLLSIAGERSAAISDRRIPVEVGVPWPG